MKFKVESDFNDSTLELEYPVIYQLFYIVSGYELSEIKDISITGDKITFNSLNDIFKKSKDGDCGIYFYQNCIEIWGGHRHYIFNSSDVDSIIVDFVGDEDD